MKFTETFLRIPIRIYDRFNYLKSFQEEMKEDNDTPLEGDWIEGMQMIYHTDIVEYSDYFDSIKGVEGVKRKGYSETLITTSNASYICTLPLKKFEELINKHVENLSNLLLEEEKGNSSNS